MIYKEGYLPPWETRFHFMRVVEDQNPDMDAEEIRAKGHDLFWEFIETLDHFYLMGPTGEIILATPLLLVRSEGGVGTGAFDIDVGLIGIYTPRFIRQGLRSFYNHWWLSRRARYLFGKFYGMAVLFSTEQVDEFMKDSEDDDTSEPTSVSAIAKLIIAGYDAGKVTRKADVQEYQDRLGPRKFLRAWEAARLKRPGLSTPGARKKRTLDSLHRIETNF
nr:hypothetical protein [Neorhizobium tomejilense]